MTKENYRWRLQIRFRDNNDLSFLSTWCVNEPYKTLKECEDASDGLLDDSVLKMQIADCAKNEIHKRYR